MPLPSPETFERAGLLAWPGIEMEWEGHWLRRAANGYTRRANCVQCFDPADGADAPARLADAVSWFEARQMLPILRITPLSSPALNAALDDEGWDSVSHSHLLALKLGGDEADGESRALEPLDPEFLAIQQMLQGYDETTRRHLEALLAAITIPSTGMVIYRDGKPAATSVVALAEGIAFTGNVVTAPARRREGLGRALMRSGHHWARSQGAGLAALNVEAGNEPAKALYRALGYAHQYDYHYRVPGERHD